MVCAQKTASQTGLRIPINRITYSVQMFWQEKSHPKSKDYILILPMHGREQLVRDIEFSNRGR